MALGGLNRSVVVNPTWEYVWRAVPCQCLARARRFRGRAKCEHCYFLVETSFAEVDVNLEVDSLKDNGVVKAIVGQKVNDDGNGSDQALNAERDALQ